MQVLKSPCPQIMTLSDMRQITGQGVIKGSGLVFKPLASMAMRFGSWGAASSAGAAAAAAEEEANMEALADALRQKEEAEGEQERAQQVCLVLSCSCYTCSSTTSWVKPLRSCMVNSAYTPIFIQQNPWSSPSADATRYVPIL